MLDVGKPSVIIASIISFNFVLFIPLKEMAEFCVSNSFVLTQTGFTPRILYFSVFGYAEKFMTMMMLESLSVPLMEVITNYDLSDDGILKVNQKPKACISIWTSDLG
jgi:hypothetical protein